MTPEEKEKLEAYLAKEDKDLKEILTIYRTARNVGKALLWIVGLCAPLVIAIKTGIDWVVK